MEEKPKRIGGRGKGTRNRTTVQIKAIIQKIVNDEIDKLPTLLESLKPVDRANVVCKLIAYLIPKKQSIDLELPAERFTPLSITIIEPKLLTDETN